MAPEAPQLSSLELEWTLLKQSVSVGLFPALLHAPSCCLPRKPNLFHVELVFISTNKNGLRSQSQEEARTPVAWCRGPLSLDLQFLVNEARPRGLTGVRILFRFQVLSYLITNECPSLLFMWIRTAVLCGWASAALWWEYRLHLTSCGAMGHSRLLGERLHLLCLGRSLGRVQPTVV